MPPFQYIEPQTIPEALARLSAPGATPMGGGTDLLPQVKDGIIAADSLIGLAAIPGLTAIAESADGGMTIGAAATIAAVAAHPAIRRRYAALSQAAAGLATPQIRHQATIGGNLCQRPRCWHYRSPQVVCLKKGGDRCHALAAHTRLLCVTGGDRCYIVHPSDTAVALTALDARLQTAAPDGGRELPIADFFAGPGRDVRRENILAPGELLTRIILPAAAPQRSIYRKVRERESGDFALVSAAAALWLEGDGPSATITRARIALGGVAPVPHPAHEAAAYLTGRPIAQVSPAQAAAQALPNPAPLPQNAYKIPMARNTIQQALTTLLEND